MSAFTISRRHERPLARRPDVLGLLLHDFRRTAVHNLERAGVPRSSGMKMTGHRTESVYTRYDIVSDADLQMGRHKLERHSSAIVDANRVL